MKSEHAEADQSLRSQRRQEGEGSRDWLVGGGEMGKVIRGKDWSQTALGPIESWPQSLRTTVSLCLASNFPISLAWGPNHTQIYNDGYWPICGEKHPVSMGLDFSECWETAWPIIGESFERALAGETSYLENQRMFLDRNGYLEETFFTFSFSPIRDESGGVGGLFHPVTETTARMLSERRTRTLRDLAARAGKAQNTREAFDLARECLAESALDLPFVLFYLLDSEGKQAQLVTQFGLAPDGAACPGSIALAGPPAATWPLAQVTASGQAIEIDDLSARFGALVAGPYPESPDGALALPITPPGCERPAGILICGVSARLPLNEAYRAFYDLLAAGVTTAVANARAYEEERKRALALAEIDRAKTAFFSNVSHEFRTPLTLMLGPLEDELAERDQPLPAARRERLEAAHRNSLRLLKLVNTLLDFSRIEAGRVQASYEPIDLAALTGELVSVFRSAVEKAGLSLTVDCPALPEPIYVDREMWEKIVLNLISNAFKHTFAGEIKVALRHRGDHAELTVTDSGVGIAAAELPRLFDRFHRVKGARSRTHEGTGIGLALVSDLVRLHGGTVQVASEEGKGSTFTVTLKTGRSHLADDRIAAARTSSSTALRAAAYVNEALHWSADTLDAPAAAAFEGGLTALPVRPDASAGRPATAARPRSYIVWADDNADMRDYVRRLLSDHYEVLAVPDGEAAVAAARIRLPDLVLSDVMMPRLDGFGLLRELRGDVRTRGVPVILLSARAGEEASVEGLAAGADDYLAKPFSARELLARVRTHLDMARGRRQWAQQLEQANRELEAFSYSVSHDLRAPLRAIDGFSKALLTDYAGNLDDKGQHFVRRVRANAQRMSDLIDGLLDLSSVSRAPLTRATVDLSSEARKIVAELQGRDPNRKLDLQIDDRLTAGADPRLVVVMLENLLGNAWKFTAKTPHARIEVGRQDNAGEAVFFVRDNGAGFDMTHATRLFSPFERMHDAEAFEGTGIGLATVHRIVTRHHGHIWSEAAIDKGATFFFTLEASE